MQELTKPTSEPSRQGEETSLQIFIEYPLGCLCWFEIYIWQLFPDLDSPDFHSGKKCVKGYEVARYGKELVGRTRSNDNGGGSNFRNKSALASRLR